MATSSNIQLTTNEWTPLQLQKGTYNIYPEIKGIIIYLSSNPDGSSPVMITHNEQDFTFTETTTIYLKTNDPRLPVNVFCNDYSIKVSANIQSPATSGTIILSNEYQDLSLQAGTWNIYPETSNQILQVSLTQDGQNPVTIFGNHRQFYLPQPTVLYIKCKTIDPEARINAYYNNYAVTTAGSSGTSENSVTQEQLQAVEHKVDNNSLLIDELNRLIETTKGNLQYVGQIQQTNETIKLNKNLLTEFVKQTKNREPISGDIIITNDQPPYSWIYATNRDSQGQVISHLWDTFGNTGISQASNTELGLVKGSIDNGKVSIESDGTMSIVNGITAEGRQQFRGVVEFNNNIIARGRIRFTDNTISIAPNVDQTGRVYLSDGSIGSNCYANLDMENKGRIVNMPPPTNRKDATPKGYVDDKIQEDITQAKQEILNSVNVSFIGNETPTVDNVSQNKLTIFIIQPQA